TAKDATSSNAQMMNDVVNAVLNSGITKDEISTAGFSIYPVYNDSVPDPTIGIHKSVLTGYRASNTLYVKTTKLSLAGNIIDPLGQKIIGVKMVSLSEFNMPPVPMYYGAKAMTDMSTPVFAANQD